MNKCVHHWDIDSGDVGRCVKCGAVVDFKARLYKHFGLTDRVKEKEVGMMNWEPGEYYMSSSIKIVNNRVRLEVR